jgi:kynurenine formamidase
MSTRNYLFAGMMLLLAANAVLWAVDDQPDETPIGPVWWPSEWGADDQRGAANRLTPDKVLEASGLIREGKVYQLGRLYEHGIPVPGKRHYSLTIPGLPTGSPMGSNQLVHNDELVSGEIGQVGTQFDGLGHIGVNYHNDNVFYNGFKLSEFGDAYGLKKLGIENVGPVFTRGLLLDIAALKGVPRLEAGHVIRDADLQEALQRAGLTIHAGDVVLVRTGHGQLWMQDNEQFGAGEPGLGMQAARWLSQQQVVIVGSDNWAIEAVPHEDDERPFSVHQWLLVRHGIYLLENLDLEELSRERVYEFAFVFAPLRLKGATGSPGNPIAVR